MLSPKIVAQVMLNPSGTNGELKQNRPQIREKEGESILIHGASTQTNNV
jgi:hypothetical protein